MRSVLYHPFPHVFSSLFAPSIQLLKLLRSSCSLNADIALALVSSYLDHSGSNPIQSDAFHYLCALAFVVSADDTASSQQKSNESLIAVWSVLSVAEMDASLPLTAASRQLFTILNALFETSKSISVEGFSHSLQTLIVESFSSNGCAEALAGWLILFAHVALEGSGKQRSTNLVKCVCDELCVALAVTAKDTTSETANATVVCEKSSALLKILAPALKQFSSYGADRSFMSDVAKMYALALGLGYCALAAAVESSHLFSDAKELSSVLNLIGRWKAVLSYSIARAPSNVYQMSHYGCGLLSGLTRAIRAIAACANEQISEIFAVSELVSVVHAVAARKHAQLRSFQWGADIGVSASVDSKGNEPIFKCEPPLINAETLMILFVELDTVIGTIVGAFLIMDIKGVDDAVADSLYALIASCLMDACAVAAALHSMSSESIDTNCNLKMSNSMENIMLLLFSMLPVSKSRVMIVLANNGWATTSVVHNIYGFIGSGHSASSSSAVVQFIAAAISGVDMLFKSLQTEIVDFNCSLMAAISNSGLLCQLYLHIGQKIENFNLTAIWKNFADIQIIRLQTHLKNCPISSGSGNISESKSSKSKNADAPATTMVLENVAALAALMNISHCTQCDLESMDTVDIVIHSARQLLKEEPAPLEIKRVPTRLFANAIVNAFDYFAVRWLHSYMVSSCCHSINCN